MFRRYLPFLYLIGCLGVVFIYEVIGYINSYVVNLKGASKDAEFFHQSAIEWLQNGQIEFAVNSQFYIQLLGILYKIFTPDEYLAVQLNILAILGSMYLMNNILIGLQVKPGSRLMLILLVALWPSFIPRAGAAMREPLIIFTFIGFVKEWLFFSIKGKIESKCLLLIYAFLLFSLHKAFAVITLALIFLMVVKYLLNINFKSYKGVLTFLLLIVFMGGGAFITQHLSFEGVEGLRELRALVNNDQSTIDSILSHKAGITERASYGTKIDLTSIEGMILTYPVVIFHYMFEPFPTRITSLYDVYALLEVFWRVYVMYTIVKYRKRMNSTTWFLLIIYILVMSVWAAGTTNYGTASRHHLTHNWILVIIFGALRFGQTVKRRPVAVDV